MNFRYHHHSSTSLLTLYAPATIYIYTYNVVGVDNTDRWRTTWDVRVGNIVGGDNMYMMTICTVRIALHEIAYEARLCDKHTNYIHKTIKKILEQQHLRGDNMCSEVRHILSPTTICTCITFLSATICAHGRQYVQWGSVHIVADDNMYRTTICTVTGVMEWSHGVEWSEVEWNLCNKPGNFERKSILNMQNIFLVLHMGVKVICQNLNICHIEDELKGQQLEWLVCFGFSFG